MLSEGQFLLLLLIIGMAVSLSMGLICVHVYQKFLGINSEYTFYGPHIDLKDQIIGEWGTRFSSTSSLPNYLLLGRDYIVDIQRLLHSLDHFVISVAHYNKRKYNESFNKEIREVAEIFTDSLSFLNMEISGHTER